MHISLICAMANHRVIGRDNQLPWHLPNDLKRFKLLTINKTIVMGRKTYESIGRPLPQRRNIILSSDLTYRAEGCEVIHSMDELTQCLKMPPAEEIFIIGGSQLYETFLPLAQTIYLTKVAAELEGDTFFPLFNEHQWKTVSCEEYPADDQHEYAYQFLVLKRKQGTDSHHVETQKGDNSG